MATRLRLPTLGSALPWGLAALSLILAFGQRHGRTYTDTRVELTADPGLFLDRVTSVWSPTLDLGHVQSGQFVGYLFPMGPYFAGTEALGVPAWIAERIWLAALLWLAGWGTVLLVDALYSRRRGSSTSSAAILYLANPYVVVQANRGDCVRCSPTPPCRGSCWPHTAGLREPPRVALAGAARARRGGEQRRDERGHGVLDRGGARRARRSTRSLSYGPDERDALAFAWRAALSRCGLGVVDRPRADPEQAGP